MSGNHDLGYKQLFAHPEMVRDLLAGFTGCDCFRGLGAEAFDRVNASFVSEHFSERHGDMVWKVQLSNHIVYVYLLLEFQSQAERWMALRMHVYVGLLYQDLVKRHEFASATTLPPVLPVVFYNGRAPWSASEELNRLVAEAPGELNRFQANQRYLLIDQHSIDPATLLAARSLVAALFRIELSDSPSVLIEILGTLGGWLCGDAQSSLRRSVASWINRLKQRELLLAEIPDVLPFLEDKTMGERFQRKYATWRDAIEDEGRQKGLVQGLEQGREEGKLLAMHNMLKRQLNLRFGELPCTVIERIDQAGEPEVERWLERVLDARSVESVFAN